MDFSFHILCRLSAVLLLLMMSGCSSFELTAWPPAEVYENNERIGTTPYTFSLVSGSRDLTLRRMGYVDREISITAVDPKRQHFELDWVALTELNSLPEKARVLSAADGNVLGVTPCRLHLARPQDVVLMLPGFEEMTATLTPNRKHVVELKPVHGFKASFIRSIYFTSQQGAVEIYDPVAGEKVGITPVRLRVEAGSTLEYRLAGHAAGHGLISRNAPHRIDIKLKPIAEVELCGPVGALVYRAGDSESIGMVPHTVRVDRTEVFEVRMQGYYDRAVTVAPGSPRRINVELERIPRKTIVSDPPGGEVYRLGALEKLGIAPLTILVEDESVFEIRKEGYKTCIIGVGPSSPEQLSVTLTPVPEGAPNEAAVRAFDNAVLKRF